MAEKSKSFEDIKKEISNKLDGVEIQSTKSIFDDLMVALYSTANKTDVKVSVDDVKKWIADKAGNVIMGIDVTKDQLKFAEQADKEKVEKAKWLYKWAKDFVDKCQKACADVKESDAKRKAVEIAKRLVKIFNDFTKVPWYAAISKYWKNFKKYFGDKNEIQAAQTKLAQNSN